MLVTTEISASISKLLPPGTYWTARMVESVNTTMTIRQGILQPLHNGYNRGLFITLRYENGMGYAATADLSKTGLANAVKQAQKWTKISAKWPLINLAILPIFTRNGHYTKPISDNWDTLPLKERIDILQDASAALAIDPRIVDWTAQVNHTKEHSTLWSSEGGNIEQEFSYIYPVLSATADNGQETQRRRIGWTEGCQGGLKQLAELGFPGQAQRLAEEAIELLCAPQCPTGIMDIILNPSQMVLQIHESIGHPLELDRILGDERNYAGTSFVTLDMFGKYRYGSDLLNITFDPNRSEQLASYGFDDDGTPAEHVYIIRNGILERPLGALTSQQRTGLLGTANSRACSWNRPPIDRMANLNLEPGDQTLAQLISKVDNGVFMDSNRSWSIDDSRNKFQFGCEYGRLIQNGALGPVVRNPNYRGISAEFWRSLDGVGDISTMQVLGVSNCGKGEPNQSISVGHASPACRFRNVAVFGGD